MGARVCFVTGNETSKAWHEKYEGKRSLESYLLNDLAVVEELVPIVRFVFSIPPKVNDDEFCGKFDFQAPILKKAQIL